MLMHTLKFRVSRGRETWNLFDTKTCHGKGLGTMVCVHRCETRESEVVAEYPSHQEEAED